MQVGLGVGGWVGWWGGGGGVDGGSLCRKSIIRNGNVALSNLRKRHVALSK